MSVKFKDYLEERVKDKDFRAEYEALSCVQDMEYWDGVIENAKKVAKSGKNIAVAIECVSEALSILKAAVPAGA